MNINRSYKAIAIFLFFAAVFFLFLKSCVPKAPHVLLITIDSLRADHLGCYGYQRNTSPNIDKLAKEGVLFLNCFATGSSTVWSFPGLLTGRYLEVRNADYVLMDNILDKKFITLAEYLKNAGYYTAGFMDKSLLNAGRGFEQGFDYYFYNISGEKGDARAITERVISFLNNYKNNKPFFIWMHSSGCHVSYRFPDRGKYLSIFENDELYKQNDKKLKFTPEDTPNYFISRGYIPRIVSEQGKYNLNYYIACYDAKLRYTDFYLGELLKSIKDNIRDNMIIILTADHGESLGEHNVYFSHGENIHDELLHIPLIINDNRSFKGAEKISTAVSSVDIVPTVLSRINPNWYFLNKNRFDGRDLARLVKNKAINRKYLYSYSPYSRSIRDIKKNVKYVLTSNTREELFLLPDEYANHINSKSKEAASVKEELRETLQIWLKNYPVQTDINAKKRKLDENLRHSLRFLGYIQ